MLLHAWGYLPSRWFIGCDDTGIARLQHEYFLRKLNSRLTEGGDILWASWCDLVVAALRPDGCFGLEYYGNSLSDTQITDLETFVYKPGEAPLCFGRKSDRGFIGFLDHQRHLLKWYPTAGPNGAQYDPEWQSVHTIDISQCSWKILDIKFTARSNLFISYESRENTGAHGILDIPSSAQFLKILERRGDATPHSSSSRLDCGAVMCKFSPSIWVSNDHTFTAVNHEGEIYSYCNDYRYYTCCGRESPSRAPSAHAHVDDPMDTIPCFEGQKVIKVASGGKYTAALTEDEDFWIWGPVDSALEIMIREPIYDDTDEVREVEIDIGGRVARVKDFAIGNGHIVLVAGTDDGKLEAVFGAGSNDYRQLAPTSSVPFLPTFVQLLDTTERRVKRLWCEGRWTMIQLETDEQREDRVRRETLASTFNRSLQLIGKGLRRRKKGDKVDTD